MVYTQFNELIKMDYTDKGTEYFNLILADFFKNNRILHESSCIDTPKQNGIAERKNRYLLEVARSLLFSANVPKYFRRNAVLTACHLINRLPTKSLNFITPLDFFSNLFPTSRNFFSLEPCVFGCRFCTCAKPRSFQIGPTVSQMCFRKVLSQTKKI